MVLVLFFCPSIFSGPAFFGWMSFLGGLRGRSCECSEWDGQMILFFGVLAKRSIPAPTSNKYFIHIFIETGCFCEKWTPLSQTTSPNDQAFPLSRLIPGMAFAQPLLWPLRAEGWRAASGLAKIGRAVREARCEDVAMGKKYPLSKKP